MLLGFRRAPAGPPAPRSARQLIERAAYRLPDRTVVVASLHPHGAWSLATLVEWEHQRPAAYAVDPEGAVTKHGERTRWTVEDLEPMPVLLPAPIARPTTVPECDVA